jgi:hypothetical protein
MIMALSGSLSGYVPGPEGGCASHSNQHVRRTSPVTCGIVLLMRDTRDLSRYT